MRSTISTELGGHGNYCTLTEPGGHGNYCILTEPGGYGNYCTSRVVKTLYRWQKYQ